MATIHNFRPRPQPDRGISGLFFWAMSRRDQIIRIRALLSRGLTVEQVSTMVHETTRTVRSLAEAQ